MKRRNEMSGYDVENMAVGRSKQFFKKTYEDAGSDHFDMSEISVMSHKQFLSMIKNSQLAETDSGVDIYEARIMEELFENDEISAEEEGFMIGYLEG